MTLPLLAVCILLFVAQGLYRNWGQKTFDALPGNIDEASEWAGKDHDKVWYTRWVKYVKGWFAVGPYSNYSWARWRMYPKVLFAVKGEGKWRWESSTGDMECFCPDLRDGMCGNGHDPDTQMYLSRIQYWARWHFAIQWPLQVTFHVYLNSSDVPTYPNRALGLSIKNFFYAYGPTHRDSDKVYWLLSFFVGGSWK